MIASGEHPVPIDLETILQPSAEEHKANDPEGEAFDAAMEIVGNSVMTVGLLPAYGRSVDNNVFAMGGMTPDWNSRSSRQMERHQFRRHAAGQGEGAKPDYTEPAACRRPLRQIQRSYREFRRGLCRLCRISCCASAAPQRRRLCSTDFAGLPVRKVVRPTRFYYMLLQRLKDHRDHGRWRGVVGASRFRRQAFGMGQGRRPAVAAASRRTRGAAHAERAAFRDAERRQHDRRCEWRCGRPPRQFPASIAPWRACKISTNRRLPGRSRSSARIPNRRCPPLPGDRQAGNRASRRRRMQLRCRRQEFFRTEADRIAAEIAHHAIRRGPGAAWIGLDWLGDAEVFQLVCLGPDLYNGTTGIALFLAAHAAATGSAASGRIGAAPGFRICARI